MSIRFKFDGPSFYFGLIGALIATGHVSAWVILLALLILFDLPSPKISFSSQNGWSFTWWQKPPA